MDKTERWKMARVTLVFVDLGVGAALLCAMQSGIAWVATLGVLLAGVFAWWRVEHAVREKVDDNLKASRYYDGRPCAKCGWSAMPPVRDDE